MRTCAPNLLAPPSEPPPPTPAVGVFFGAQSAAHRTISALPTNEAAYRLRGPASERPWCIAGPESPSEPRDIDGLPISRTGGSPEANVPSVVALGLPILGAQQSAFHSDNHVSGQYICCVIAVGI